MSGEKAEKKMSDYTKYRLIEKPAMDFDTPDNNDFFLATGQDWEKITGRNKGNLVWDGVVAPYLEQVEFENEYVRRWFPEEGSNRLVVLDPAIQMGAPVLTGTRIQTANVVSMIAAGDAPAFVANCFGVDIAQVEAAERFESRLRKAA